MSFIFVLFLNPWFLRAETVLTQTVGTSAFQVVTSREVKATELIARALEKEMDDPSSEITQDTAGRTLIEIAVYRESQSLSAVKVEPEEMQALMTTLKNRLQKNSEWRRLEVSDEELKTWIERKKVANEYMKLKVSSLTVIVTDQEIKDYYDKNRIKFGSTPLEDQKDNIRLFLQKESQRQRIQEWITALKTKYQIRNDLVDLNAGLAGDGSGNGHRK